MSLEIFNFEQGTPEWFECRRGIPTASMFSTVMAKGKGGGESKTRRAYMLKLIGERLTGECAESYSNPHMERGKVMEAEARDLYCMVNDVTVDQVGFFRLDSEKGCSPDGVIGENGLLEIKTKLPHLQLEVLLSGEIPGEHHDQCYGALWITGREWLDFVSYWPGLKPFIKRLYRDEQEIAKISSAVNRFNEEMGELMQRIETL